LFVVNYLFKPASVGFSINSSIIDGTSKCIKDSEVIFLLESHDNIKHKLFQNQILQQYADPENDILLLEESCSLTSSQIQQIISSSEGYSKNNFPAIKTLGWDHEDLDGLMDEVRNKRVYQSITKAVAIVRKSFLNEYVYNVDLPKSYEFLIRVARRRKSNPKLFSKVKWKNELENGNYTSQTMYRIASELDQIIDATFQDLILYGIHDARQDSLIKNIQIHSQSLSTRKIFVIAGYLHGDTRENTIDIFRESALKVTRSLKDKNISYMTLFPKYQRSCFNFF